MDGHWRDAITELHRFFEGWFRGAIADGDREFGSFAGALASAFTLIGPEGRRVERGPLLTALRAAHGTRPDLRIRIENPRLHWELGGVIVASYEEWHEQHGETKARLSTAVLRRRSGDPGNLEWLHVHETWMPGGPGARPRP